MAKALKCDRCGSFYDLLITGRRNYQIRDLSDLGKEKCVDLCPECYTTFTKWIAREKAQSDPISDLADSVYGTGELYPGEFEEECYR